ncbi:hypothetical protein PYCCODRAFT_1369048 [Trametes coccinea BRFM310]|uniref:Uncharacterized protein n=1 Tax=Trametes coccinea (strain BRFM310) TaxID=1353009 RepID=A0A1Y2IKK9_TRAC3|nr:hypothetical protein PYCCODRAFT_1369048 [Trametes coccinea BRFM310]
MWSAEECLRSYQAANEQYWNEHGLSMTHPSPSMGQSGATTHGQPTLSAVTAFEVLPQHDYVAKRQFQPRPSIVFRTATEPFIRLADALAGNIAGLLGRDEAVFSQAHLTQKQSLRLEIVGSRSYERQINVRSPAHGSSSITKGRLAEKIARELFEYFARYQVAPLVSSNVSLRQGTRDFGKLVLLELRHVSKSSWQPILGVLRSS